MKTITKFQDETMKAVVANPSPVILMPLPKGSDTAEKGHQLATQLDSLLELMELGIIAERTEAMQGMLDKELEAIKSDRIFRVFVPTEVGILMWTPGKLGSKPN
jgi:hypothetical protein